MISSRRERGFYWIRLRGDYPDLPLPWIVAEWDGEGWIVAKLVNPVPPDLVAMIDDVPLRSPSQRYARMIPEPMRHVPPRSHHGIGEALRRLDAVLSGGSGNSSAAA